MDFGSKPWMQPMQGTNTQSIEFQSNVIQHMAVDGKPRNHLSTNALFERHSICFVTSVKVQSTVEGFMLLQSVVPHFWVRDLQE